MKKCFSILFLAALALTACDDKISDVDDAVGSVTTSSTTGTVTINVSIPEDAEGAVFNSEVFYFMNLSTGRTYSDLYGISVELVAGIYDISYEADVTLTSGAASQIRASKASVQIAAGENIELDLEAYNNRTSDDLIIAEVFFTGTLQTSGNQYNGDQYVKLYNNSDHVIYADGLTLFESKFLTTEKRTYTPDIMAEAMTVQALYTVPGSGTDHPVQPGEYFLLCDTGIDHRATNPNSFDLTHADYEWYDVSSSPSNLDIDSPYVPNLDKWYCYTLSFWILHNRGFKAWGIARIPVEKESYLVDYWYDYDYEIVSTVGNFPMTGSAYKLPNDWIVDVVTCAVASDYAWQVCAPALDCGWTYCGTIDSDKTRYFHSVRRKMLYLNDDGNPVLKDTNNSTVDFNAYCIPSEIERQGTAVDSNGTPCTQLTYDGVWPIEQ